MNGITTFPLLVLAVALLSACSSAPREAPAERIFRGEAAIGNLKAAVQRSPLAGACPLPAIRQVEYVFTDFSGGRETGREHYRVMETGHGLAGLAMSAVGRRADGLFGEQAWPSGSGRVVSCAGLFTLAFREQAPRQTGVPAAASPQRRYEVIRTGDYRGRLFPLRVGNELSFNFTAWRQAVPGQAQQRSTARARFRVLDAVKSFKLHGVTIPGVVFLVERELLGSGGAVTRQQDFYYAERLGWVVRSVSYAGGEPVSVMDIAGWDGHRFY